MKREDFIVILGVLSLGWALLAKGQTSSPIPPAPGQTLVVPDSRLPGGFTGRPEAFREYEMCIAAHRKEIDLHNSARRILEIREKRAILEAAWIADPAARARAPGGVEELLARNFAHYKSLGGPAASVAEVREIPSPCPTR